MNKFLRSKQSGVVFDFNELMAKQSDYEIIHEREAFPERFAPVPLEGREAKVMLTVDEEVVEAPAFVAQELSAQRGAAFGAEPPLKRKKKDTETSQAPSMPKVTTGLKGEF